MAARTPKKGRPTPKREQVRKAKLARRIAVNGFCARDLLNGR